MGKNIAGRVTLAAGTLALTGLVAGCSQQPGAAFPTPTVQMAPGPLAGLAQRIQGGFGAAPAAPVAGAPAAGGVTPQVTDPFAGQGVRQPVVPGAAAVQPAPAASGTPAAATAARVHTVAAGETGWSVARKYGVTIQALAQANGLSESMTLRTGQKLNIPAGGSVVAANTVSAPGVGSPTPPPPSAAKPLPAEKTTPASTPAPKTDAPDLGKTRTKASGGGRLAMPVSGSISRAYAKGKNEGIDISASPGATVKAAGSGMVAAITRDTQGTPIVVVRHSGDLLTVYAGLDALSVEKGQKVSTGQAIGKARAKGPVHFEVRNGFESVDPEKYLN